MSDNKTSPAITQTSTPAPPAPRHWQPDEPSSPESRKLGSVTIERRVGGRTTQYYVYRLRYPDGYVLEIGAYSSSGTLLWAAAEQFEALQALARSVNSMPAISSECMDDVYEALEKVRALGALGKEKSDANA